MIKCAIFDLDGTLVDSMSYWEKAPVEFSLRKNIEPEEKLSDTFLSMSLFSFANYFKDKYHLDDSIESIMSEIDSIMETHYERDVNVKNGMKELLDMLSKENVKLAIATQTDKYLVEKVLKKTGLDPYISFILTCGEVGKSKSSSLIYEECAKHFGVPFNETMVFEDLPYGIESSKKKGFITVGLFDVPSIKHQERIKRSADYYFVDMDLASRNLIKKLLKNSLD